MVCSRTEDGENGGQFGTETEKISRVAGAGDVKNETVTEETVTEETVPEFC